jgi:hypothetical protein
MAARELRPELRYRSSFARCWAKVVPNDRTRAACLGSANVPSSAKAE